MNNAVINFLFNSKGAIKELESFKSNFTKSIDAISNSSIGKLGRIGTVLGSVFSVKSAVRQTKAVKDFINIYGDLPIDKVNQFANSISLMAGDIETGTDEALGFLGKLQDGLSNLRKSEGIFANQDIQSIFSLGGMKISADDSVFDVVEKIRNLYTSGLVNDEMMRPFFEQLGLSNTADLYQFFKQSEERWQRTSKIARTMGGATQTQIEAMEKWNESIAMLQGKFRDFGNTLVESNLPNAINKITDALNWFINQGEGTQNAIMGIIAALLFGGPLVRDITAIFGGLISAVKGVFSVCKLLFLLLASPAGLLIAFGGLIFALSTNFMGFADAVDESINSFDNFINDLRKNHRFLAEVLQQVSDFTQAMAHPFDTMGSAITGIIEGKSAKEIQRQKDALNGKVTNKDIEFYRDRGVLSENEISQYKSNGYSNAMGNINLSGINDFVDNIKNIGLDEMITLQGKGKDVSVNQENNVSIFVNGSQSPQATANEVMKRYKENVLQFSNFGQSVLVGE